MNDTEPICTYCGASPSIPLHEAMIALKGCNNCRVDIHMKGEWTGDGWRVLQALREKHGHAYFAKAWREQDEACKRGGVSAYIPESMP